VTSTPLTLLERLRKRPDAAAWQRWTTLYRPVIYRWLSHYHLQPSDADDISQEVCATVVQHLTNFQHNNQTGAFRRWLRGITINRIREHWRARPERMVHNGLDVLAQVEDPTSPLSQTWDREHDQVLVAHLLALIEPEFEAASWKAFRGIVLESRDTAAVAKELGLTANAVRIAKSRVLRRMREEIDGLIG
jgi:RNA polymerase sigma-70 factor (ECF subfamily)